MKKTADFYVTEKNIKEGLKFAKKVGYPVFLKPAYTLRGEGSSVVHDEAECVEMLNRAIKLSPINEVKISKYLP